jgi:hypothetical protein
MVFEPLFEQAGGGWIGGWIASFGIGAALMAIHRAYCDVRDAVPAPNLSYLCCDNRSEILRCRRSSSDRLISTVTSSSLTAGSVMKFSSTESSFRTGVPLTDL